jgi:anti-sigma-K factor RskA
VLGDVSEQERLDVEKNLSLYPLLREEVLKIEETQEKFLMKTAIKPRAELKKEIIAKISSRKPLAKEVQFKPINWWQYVAAASLALTLVFSYLTYNYWNKWRNVKSDLEGLIAQNQQIAQDYDRVNQQLDKIEEDKKIIDNPAFKRVVLKGTENAPTALAYVYWNDQTNEVFLSIQNMQALDQGNQYQLWAIADGGPVDAGVFDADSTGLIKMKAMDKAGAFAVTIEPRGGKASPTLETMQVLGEV